MKKIRIRMIPNTITQGLVFSFLIFPSFPLSFLQHVGVAGPTLHFGPRLRIGTVGPNAKIKLLEKEVGLYAGNRSREKHGFHGF
jgi:hypothetical protein